VCTAVLPTDLGIDPVAHAAGFGTAAALRYHFGERVGTTAAAYRRTFRGRRLTPV
jgi:AraC family transcriptional regulator, transcriptional activator FtrA